MQEVDIWGLTVVGWAPRTRKINWGEITVTPIRIGLLNVITPVKPIDFRPFLGAGPPCDDIAKVDIPDFEHPNLRVLVDLGVSKNSGPPKSSILIGFSIIFTIHFGGKIPLFLHNKPKHKQRAGANWCGSYVEVGSIKTPEP